MLSKVQEKALYNLGASMYNEGLPLGFIQSDYFNFEFKQERVSKVKSVLLAEAKKKYDLSGDVPSDFNKNLLMMSYLLEETACFLTTSPKQELGNEDPAKSGKIEQCLATLNEEVIEGILGEGYTEQLAKRFAKAKDKFSSHLQHGLMFVPSVDYSRVPKMKIGRLPVNVVQNEYQLIPVSVINGYVDTLRSSLQKNIIKITCRKTGGDMREFLIYGDYDKILDIYKDEDLAIMFESVGTKNKRTLVRNLNFELLTGLHNANLLFFELGIPKDDYPKRYMNLLRLRSIDIISDSDEVQREITSQLRYIDISFDDFVRDIKEMVSSWGIERKEEFLNNVLREYKTRSNLKAHEHLEIGGSLDFNVKFDKAVDFYSTTFLRTVVDYVVERPVEFNGYTGKKFSVEELTSSAVAINSDVTSLADLSEIDFE